MTNFYCSESIKGSSTPQKQWLGCFRGQHRPDSRVSALFSLVCPLSGAGVWSWEGSPGGYRMLWDWVVVLAPFTQLYKKECHSFPKRLPLQNLKHSLHEKTGRAK